MVVLEAEALGVTALGAAAFGAAEFIVYWSCGEDEGIWVSFS